MSSTRHQRANSANRVNNINRQSSFRSSSLSSDKLVDVEEWLNKAKLSTSLSSIFATECITVEELLTFTDTELLSVAEETLNLGVLHKKRFINAMNDTKQTMKIQQDMRGHVYSRSSSNLMDTIPGNPCIISSIHRPISPSLSTHSAHSANYSFNRTKYNHLFGPFNPNNHNTQSPLITTTKYNNHYYHRRLPASAQFMPSLPPKSVPKMKHMDLVGKPSRRRRHSTSETEKPSAADSSYSSSNNSSESTHSTPHSAQSMPRRIIRTPEHKRMKKKRKSVKKKPKKKSKFKRERQQRQKQKESEERSKTYDTMQRQFKITRCASSNSPQTSNIDKMTRMRLNLSEDEMNESSSHNDGHSEDEKWTFALNTEEKEHMKTMSVVLQENKADMNQMEAAVKMLNHHYRTCETQLNEYFDGLEHDFAQKRTQAMEILSNVKREKEKVLDMKQMQLEQHKKHVLRQKYLCDKLINDNDGNAMINIQQRQKKIAQLSDNAVHQQGENMELDDIDSLIEIHFDPFQLGDICVVKDCVVPHAPYITAKIGEDGCVMVRIVIMTSKEKKAIQHDPLSNHSKNKRIEQIQTQYIQSKSTNIEQIETEFDKEQRSMKKGEEKENEERVQQIDIMIDHESKLKRIHEVMIDSDKIWSSDGYYCFIRSRISNMNGWSAYCEPIAIPALPMMPLDDSVSSSTPTPTYTPCNNYNTHLKFDLDHSSHGKGVCYELDDTCVMFCGTAEHQIGVMNTIIDKREFGVFEWKYIVGFEPDYAEEKETNKKKKKKKKQRHTIDGICMGFVACPLEKCIKYKNVTLGRSGTQYGLCVSAASDTAHAFFTRSSATHVHHSCDIKLHKKVENGDEFRMFCNMKKGQCDVYHNDQLLLDVFGTKLPNKIIPAVSGCCTNGNVSCRIQFISSSPSVSSSSPNGNKN